METMGKDYGFNVVHMLQNYLVLHVGVLFVVYSQKKEGMGDEVRMYVLFVMYIFALVTQMDMTGAVGQLAYR